MLYYNKSSVLCQCIDFRHFYTLMSLLYGNYGAASGAASDFLGGEGPIP